MDASALGSGLEGIVRLLTCGSVDDGKSTLIGRLLWDAADVPEDQREAVIRAGRISGGGRHFDYSLLVDGLVAERQQGITIDVAWRYFDTDRLRFVVIDTPGHEQYTRNMASGASHADVAVLLVDARHGIKRQTRRHAAILNLVGIRRVILAVNKMDLVDWSEARFRAIEVDFAALTARFDFAKPAVVPVSALSGENLAARSPNSPWYDGPTLLRALEAIPPRGFAPAGAFRMPVQMVLRDGRDFRGLAGTVTAGTVHVGDAVADILSGRTARVSRIATMDGDLDSAAQGQAVVLQLDSDLDIARGAVLAPPDALPVAAKSLDAQLVWLSERTFDPRTRYLLRTATDLVAVTDLHIRSLLDLESLAETPSETCGVNDIVRAGILLGRPVSLDLFSRLPDTGAFMLVDAVTGASVAGGVILRARPDDSDERPQAFQLTRALLQQGVCADLASDRAAEAEFRRRANEVAILLSTAGVAVEIESWQPPAASPTASPTASHVSEEAGARQADVSQAGAQP